MKKSKPIHILGAGPAGLASAIALTRAGREVHLHERYDRAGKRFQGDLQGLENWTSDIDVMQQFQGWGIKPAFTAAPFHEVIFSNGKTSYEHRFKKPLFYLVKRGALPGSLDTALEQQAKEQGVQFHYRSPLPAEQAGIIATGPIRKSIIAADKGLVFPTTLPNIAVGFFHDDLAFLGYSYLLVSEGYGCLCSVVFRDFHRLNSCFEKTVSLAIKMYALDLDKAHPVGGIGSFCLNHPKQKGSGLLVGESAGLQDFLWGFGIRSAITSGNLAAQSILTNESYPELIDKAYCSLQKAGIVNRFLWEKCKVKSYPIIPIWLRWLMPFGIGIHTLYRYSWLHRLLFSFAKNYAKKWYPNSLYQEEII